MRRFYFRTIAGVLGPPMILCYLVVIWQKYLVPIDPDSPVSFGPAGAKWIFYSWFVAGIIGLNLSLYGLAGAEAGMLMDPFWRVNNAMVLMLHADNTWSGPGGWGKAIKWVVRMRGTGHKQTRHPGRLWFILALPSMVVFVAWPLSGLCLEMTSGFVRGSPGSAPSVSGFVYSDFNGSPGGRSPSKEPQPDARVPGFGAVYTPQGFDRSKKNFLQQVPVVLPMDEGVEEIFLTAQGKTPIDGKAWGLLLHYECSIVDKLSDMRLLNQRRSSMDVWGSKDVRKEPQGKNNGLWDFKPEKWSLNIDAVIETAYETLLMPNTLPRENPCTYEDVLNENSPTGYCYYNTDSIAAQDNSKMDQKRIFEVLLWQGLIGPLSAIGVSCTSKSSVGTADINGVHSTFSNFSRTDTPIPTRRGECARSLGAETLACTLKLQENGWLRWFFDSVGAPLPIDSVQTNNPGFIELGFRENVQLAYLQASQLRQSLLKAFSSYAITLMYNDGRDFIAPDGSRLVKTNPNMTAFTAGTVITGNVMPAIIPIALFGFWAVTSSALCLVYGFRRRWSAMLDGHTVFRLGVELKDGYKAKFMKHSSLAEIEECSALHEIPGFVGDVQPRHRLGRIGLVEGEAADKDKYYE
ncbi:hypothetical protein COCVIDRAFT_109036 [Bipolaris victoriae FI3]|uniref:Uncharacterized protein n=1 Tax=Bipolaris victoriae (strain FI3) TaxID=930091 RepID=W7EGK3_BIPV3|nr:hypothetical protein COCVIDRAFT_109036 [Bipolaris victoriae FI3]